MNWYVAKLIFRIATPSGQEVAQFEEHLHLIRATSFEKAFIKARLIGITEEGQFSSQKENAGQWEFVNISELNPLQELPASLTWYKDVELAIRRSGWSDGLEVYSQTHQTMEARSYINLIHEKAAALVTGC